jgi:hypothetical protein
MNRKVNNIYIDEGFGGGYANGYVALPPEHPFWGKTEDIFYDQNISVHGGVTFSRPAKSARAITHTAEFISGESVPDDYWVIGFDTLHGYEDSEKYDREYVLSEIESLVRQLDEAAKTLTKFDLL